MTTDTSVSTILIVDDIPANLELICSYLGGKYHTAIAKNGEKAIQRAESLLPSLILLDVQMPGIDGYETCRRLKANPATEHIPVIFMTALTDTVNKVKGFDAGGVDYITKPVDGSELLARVNTHISLHIMREDLQRKNVELELNYKRQKRVEQILRHDLKSPLQVMFALPELVKDDTNLTEDQLELIECVREASIRMLDIIDSSLTLYKIESGKYQPTLDEVSIVAVLDKVVALIQGVLVQKKLKVVIDGTEYSDCQELTVAGEEILVYTLLANIIKNAAEASPINEEIHIQVISGDPVMILISNKGSVPLEIRDSFFEEFTTSGKKHGTGLGTYSAKLICNTLNGTIDLDSSVNDSTTIVMTLPSYK